VLVVGGGDTAIDAARVSKRMGAEVSIVYRRTRTEMPAIEEEIEGALEEGINIDYLVAPVKIIKDGEKATKMVCQRMELGEPDDSGRRRPVPIEGSEFEMDCTAVIAAISQAPQIDGLDDVSDDGRWIGADKATLQTKIDNVYVGGDAYWLGLVTTANAQGRKTADIMHAKFRGEEISTNGKMEIIDQEKLMLAWYEEKNRNERETVSVEERFKDPDAEIQIGLTTDQAIDESKRCMSCGLCFECGNCWSYCQDSAVIKPLLEHEKYVFKLEYCTGCKKCAENCPCGYIEMKM
jgi:NADPH-dependent glutamate synthase beta subunit-like oxidoreductase